MKSKSFLRRFLLASATVAAATLGSGYDLIYAPGGARVTWNNGPIPMVIRMPQTPTFQDGTNYATSVQAAMSSWNEHLANVQFSSSIVANGTAADNGLNEIVLSDQIYGDAEFPPEDFGPNVLAVTLSYRSTSPRGDGSYQRLESDILFNTGVVGGWDSYRGNLQYPEDIRRVAIHELGHVLGLDHPDEDGQSVQAIMHSTVGDLDTLTADDRIGAQFLYGRPGGYGASPGNDNFANATLINGSTAFFEVSSVGATTEAGEPDHGSNRDGASIWWKWTATVNGRVTVHTRGSEFDTLLAAYTGGSVDALNQLAANDDISDTERRSAIEFDVSAGTTYSIAVGGWDAQWGVVELYFSFTQPSNQSPLQITSHPSNVTLVEGLAAQFTVAATAGPAIYYSWQRRYAGGRDWENLPDGGTYRGVQSATLTVSPVTMAMTGDEFRCTVSTMHEIFPSEAATLTVFVPNRPPTASFTLSAERAVGQAITVSLTLGDPDGNFAYANLFVQSPGRGSLAIKADNTVAEAATVSAGIAVASSAGNHSRSFTFTSADGPGDYTFRVVAVDAAGLQFTTPTQTITVSAAADAAFTLPGTQLDLAVPAGWNHLPVRLPVARSSGTPATGFTVSSDVAWVTPAFDSATSELVLSFATTGLVTATNSATIRLMRGNETVALVVRANVAQLNPIALADDPARSRVYGLHQAGTGYGALVIFDPVTANPLGAITVGRQPGAMDIRANGTELVVLCATSKTIAAVDLESLRVTSTYSIASAYENTRPSATTGRLRYGAGGILYYVDGAWAPTLRVFDRETQTIRQALLLTGGAPANTGDFGFGDFVVSPDGSAVYGWGQYGWDAGSASSTVARLRILSDGRLEFDHANSTLGYPTFNRDPLDTPALMSADGQQLFIKQHLFDPTNLNLLKATFPAPVYSLSGNGEIAATASAIYDTRTGAKLHDLGSSRNIQTITSDYARLVYFDASSRTLRTVDLLQQIGTSGMGLADAPAQDEVVLPPSELRWIPQTGIDRYRVYLGLSQAAVAAAAPGGAEDLGEVLGPRLPLAAPLAPGATYYWRVDRVSGSQITVGPIRRFQVTSLGFSTSGISAATVRGHARQGAVVQLTSLSGTEQAWTAATTAPWIKLDADSGTTPATLSVVLDASSLSAGIYRSSVAITTTQGTVHLPVELRVDALAITRMKTAPDTTKVYALSEENATVAGQTTRAYLLEIDTLMQRIERVVQVNSGATDLAVHPADGRIYVTNWAAKKLLAVELATFGVVRSYDQPTVGAFYSSDFYRVAAGGAGRLLVEPKDQWVQIYLMDTETGAQVANAFVREGGGAFDRAGRYYFHGENNYSGAALLKFDAAGDQLSQVARSEVKILNGYGSRNVVLSGNGNRVFWNGGVYSASDLSLEWSTLSEVTASSADGRYIMTGSGVYDVTLRTQVSSLPVAVTAAAYNSQVGCFVFQNGAGLSFISQPGADTPGSSRTPAAGSVVAPLDTLQWTPLPGASAYRVYLGTSSSAVAAADPASPLFVGEVTTPSLVLPSELAVGTIYYWRVDILVAGEIATGAVQSFTVSQIAPSLTEINSATVQGHGDQAVYVELTAAAAGTAWNVTTDAPTWVKFDRARGVTPASLRVSLDATALPVGTSQGNITLTSGASTVVIPVRLLVEPLALVAITIDPDSARAYAISEHSPGTSSRAYLLELDCAAQRITRVVPAGSSATDLAWHPGDNRIYVTNWRAGNLIGFNPDSLARERTFVFPPFSGIGYSQRDAYHVAAGPPGRVMVEGYDQWIYLTLFDTVAGQSVGSYFARQGGGAYGASRRYYYHGESNSSGAVLQKIDTAGDTLRQVGTIRVTSYSYYGSRAVVVSTDGTRVFWNGSVFDEDLTELWAFGAEAFAATPDGRYAFGSTVVYDTVARQAAYLMPVTTSVSAYSGFTGKLIVQRGTAVEFYSLADLVQASPPVIQSQPSNRSTYAGGRTRFSVTVAGNGGVTYRWQRQAPWSSSWLDIFLDDGNYAGAATAHLEVVNASTLNDGYKFRCIMTNVIGSVISAEATLSVVTTAAPLMPGGGYFFAAFLRLDGTVWGMGRNQEGQLGDGTGQARLSPVQSITDAVTLAAGADHLVVLKADGSLWTTGYNPHGALGDGGSANRLSFASIATGVSRVAAGIFHTLFIKNDGMLWAAGWNGFGQLGDGTVANRRSPVLVASRVTAVAGSYAHSLFVKGDGSLWAMGTNGSGQFGNGTTAGSLTPLQVGTQASEVAAGYYHSLVVDRSGTLRAAGNNGHGQLGDGTTVSRTTWVSVDTGVVAAAAGIYHSAYLKSDGTLWAMGANDRGQLGTGDTLPRATPVQIATNVASVSAGLFTTYFAKTDGTLWAAGANDQGQLGDGTTVDRLAFVPVAAGGTGLVPANPQPSATNSAAATHVTVTWPHAIGSTHYRVLRGPTEDRTSAVPIAERVIANFYEDNSGLPGVTYYYWIQAVNPSGSLGTGAAAPGRYGVALTPPGITTPPAAQTVEVGADVTFTVVATGSAPLTYQWRKDGENIPGATAATLSLDDVTIAAAGDYDVVVSNAAGSATSTIATLTVNKLSQTITFAAISPQPIDGGNIGLTASASSGLPVQFTVISGPATLFSAGSNILVPNGTGEVVVRATQVGDATYAAAPAVELSLSITPPGHDAFAQAHLLVGGTVTGLGNTTWATRELGEPEHVPGAGGSATLWWKWTPSFSADVQMTTTGSDFDTVLAVYTGSSLGSLTLVAANDDRAPGDPLSSVSFWTPSGTTYYIAIDGKNGAKGAARLNIGAIPSSGTAPVFTTQPQPVTVTAGGTASFTINYTGQFPTTLFWQRRAVGSDTWVYVATTDSFYVTGTGISLTIRPLATMDGDEFRCVASNNLGTTYSDAAMLTVIETLDSWALEHFTEEELLDPAISGPNADPDGDGFANLLEYALGLDPRAAATSGLPEIGTANGELIYTYTRPVGRSELTYTVQFSTNLTSWTSEGVTHELVTTADGVEIWRGRVPLTAGPNLFLRLRVTR